MSNEPNYEPDPFFPPPLIKDGLEIEEAGGVAAVEEVDLELATKFAAAETELEPDRFTTDERRVFKAIDRKLEDAKVAEYIETKNEQILEWLYLLREPTLHVWAKRYQYLSDSEEEMFAELRTVWLRCVDKYEILPKHRAVKTKSGKKIKDHKGRVKTTLKHTPFNTFLFCALQHYVINLIKKKYSLKRAEVIRDKFGKVKLDDNGKPEKIPYDTTMKSLDYEYDDGDGEGMTLHDVIAGDSKPTGSEFETKWLIDQIAGHNKKIRYALEKFVNDPHIKTLQTACKLRTGVISVCKYERDILIPGGRISNNLMNELIRNSRRYRYGFSLVSYQVHDKKVDYEVRVKDDSLYLQVLRAIRRAKSRMKGSELGQKLGV